MIVSVSSSVLEFVDERKVEVGGQFVRTDVEHWAQGQLLYLYVVFLFCFCLLGGGGVQEAYRQINDENSFHSIIGESFAELVAQNEENGDGKSANLKKTITKSLSLRYLSFRFIA